MTWVPPNTKRIMQVVDKTWAAAEFIPCGPFMLRRGNGGGKRVSSASVEGAFTLDDIQQVSEEMKRLGQPELFQIADTDKLLDDKLAELGYEIIDHVSLFAAPVEILANPVSVTQTVDPTPEMMGIWAEGDIGDGRLEVMRRVTAAKTCLLGMLDNRPAAAAFVGCDAETAMLHALEVRKSARRNGLGRTMIEAAANWAKSQGARELTLVVLNENRPACDLYRSLQMHEIGHYHYRTSPPN